MIPTLVRLPADVHAALAAEAARRGVSMAECMREAVVVWLAARGR